MSSKTVEELVPGDPEEIWRHADYYNRMALICEDMGHGFRSIDFGIWFGEAAGSFHARFERQPKRFISQADCYLTAAVALDTYASTLAWTQRQAAEVIAFSGAEELSPGPTGSDVPALTLREQAEFTGVITRSDQPEPEPINIDQRALALDTYRRAIATLDTVGNESAAAISAAAEMMPGPLSNLNAVNSASPRIATDSFSSPTSGLVLRGVIPAPSAPVWVTPLVSHSDLQDWVVSIKEIRRRLRWNSLDHLSPRLIQHIFEGHYNPGGYSGYHHREGGVDKGMRRIVRMLNGPDRYGVYEAEWSGPRTVSTSTKASTFFPDAWSRAEVLLAVRHVFLDAMREKDTHYDPDNRKFRGIYKGVKIEGYVKRGAVQPRLCDILTAYPRGKWRTGRRKP